MNLSSEENSEQDKTNKYKVKVPMVNMERYKSWSISVKSICEILVNVKIMRLEKQGFDGRHVR